MIEKLQKERSLCLKAHANLSYSLGIYFGYPKCCIIEFCDDIINETIPNRYINEKGFVPCKKHHEQIINQKIKIEDLIKNRVANEKY